MELTRRGFLKSVGAATLAVAAVGLLGGCEGGEMVGNANGLNDTAELKGIKMTVRSLAYASYSDGTFYLVPEVLINNGSAAGIPLNPTGGSFKLRVNGSEELDINSDTMAICAARAAACRSSITCRCCSTRTRRTPRPTCAARSQPRKLP